MGNITIIKPKKYLSINFIREIIDYRELLYILVKRDISVKYRSTIIGVAWALIQPLLNSLIFVAVFHYFAKIPIKGHSPFAFYMASLLPWFFFSTCLNRASMSLVNHEFMISKVYFPRMILPLASCITTLYDSFFQVISFLLIVIILGPGIPWNVIFIIPLFLYLFFISFTISLWVSILSALYKDMQHIVPFFIQILFFLTPIFYTYENIPERFRLYASLNPLIPIPELFRWSLLKNYNIINLPIVLPITITTLILITGIFYFQKKDAIIADIL